MALEAAIRRDPILTERQSALVNGALTRMPAQK